MLESSLKSCGKIRDKLPGTYRTSTAILEDLVPGFWPEARFQSLKVDRHWKRAGSAHTSGSDLARAYIVHRAAHKIAAS